MENAINVKCCLLSYPLNFGTDLFVDAGGAVARSTGAGGYYNCPSRDGIGMSAKSIEQIKSAPAVGLYYRHLDLVFEPNDLRAAFCNL